MILLFAGDWYYPGGGACDLRGTFATVEEAKAEAEKALTGMSWANILDTDRPTVLLECSIDKDDEPRNWEERDI